MPALSRARKQAKATVCATSLKQWGVGLGLYWAENENKFWKDYYDPTGSPSLDEKRRRRWHNALWPYVQTAKIFLCPTAKKLSYDGSNTSVIDQDVTFAAWPINASWDIPKTKGLCGSYGVNTWVCNQNDSKHWRKAGGQGFSPKK
ncbi:hypothetical protein ACFL6U_28625 [Planctomycetota bacterium]